MIEIQHIDEAEREATLAELKHLLAEYQLCYDDLTVDHLEHFGVVRIAGSLVGLIGIEPHGEAGLLRSLIVLPGYRSTGMGQQLTNWAEAYAGSLGIDEIFLLTTTAEDFFTKRNYQPISRDNVPVPIQHTAEFQSFCPDTAVCMRKRLS